MRFLTLLSLIFSLTAPPMAKAQSCAVALKKEQLSWEEKSVPITRPAQIKSYYDVAELFPNGTDGKLLVVFTDKHVYLWHKGYRVDSSGRPGLHIQTYLREFDRILGKFVFAINLTAQEDAAMSDSIENFKKISHVSCSKVACSHVHRAAPTILEGKSFLSPQKMMKSLLDKKISSPEKMEVLQITHDSLTEVFEDQKYYESNIRFKSAQTATAALGTLATFSTVLIQYLLN